jgi:predicted transcriptional regulator of viral defense system
VARQPDTVEEVIARLASRAHGVVTRRELLAAGVTRNEIQERLEKGALLREYRGVYRVGHQGAKSRGPVPRRGQGLR